MSFKAQLFINDRIINVLSCRLKFNQNKDITGKPVGRVDGGQFVVTIETDRNTDLLHQMMGAETMVDGYLRFYKRDGMSKLVDYEFWDCYVANYKVQFSAINSDPMTTQLLFSPGILRINGVVLKKPWHVTDIDAEEVEPTPEAPSNNNPRLLSTHYTDMDGNKVEDLYEARLILVVESRDCIGKTVDIDLSDDEYDFIYRGQAVKDDILRDIKITDDIQKIELEVVIEE